MPSTGLLSAMLLLSMVPQQIRSQPGNIALHVYTVGLHCPLFVVVVVVVVVVLVVVDDDCLVCHCHKSTSQGTEAKHFRAIGIFFGTEEKKRKKVFLNEK